MVLPSFISSSLGYNRPTVPFLADFSSAETGAGSGVYAISDFSGEPSCEGSDKFILLEVLFRPPHAANLIQQDAAWKMRLFNVGEGSSVAANIRVSAVFEEIQQMEENIRSIYLFFLGALVSSLTPGQATLLSLMYGIGTIPEAKLGKQTYEDRCFTRKEIRGKLAISRQRVIQIQGDICKKVQNIFTPRKIKKHEVSPQKINTPFLFPLENMKSTRVEDLQLRLDLLKDRVSKKTYHGMEEAVRHMIRHKDKALFLLPGLLSIEKSLSSYSLIVGEEWDAMSDLPEFLAFCENNDLNIKISKKYVASQLLMDLYLNLLNAACFEILKYKRVRYASRAIERLYALGRHL